ncbi:MAG: peptidylprolyl isomerase [Nitrospirota bacterium]
MGQIAEGSKVKVHYTGKLSDGTVFDSSRGSDPIEFVYGEKDLIPGFEKAVSEMSVGEHKTVTIPADDAYGPHRDDLVVCISRDQIPPEINLETGMSLRVKQPDGRDITVVVTDLDEKSVTLDANHPLAGQDLTFDLELVEVTEKK